MLKYINVNFSSLAVPGPGVCVVKVTHCFLSLCSCTTGSLSLAGVSKVPSGGLSPEPGESMSHASEGGLSKEGTHRSGTGENQRPLPVLAKCPH